MQIRQLQQRLAHDRVPMQAERRQAWLAAGGMLGAFASMSCCIVPLVLFSLGISGAWIANLTALVTFDDARTTVAALTQATAEVAFPVRVIGQAGD